MCIVLFLSFLSLIGNIRNKTDFFLLPVPETPPLSPLSFLWSSRVSFSVFFLSEGSTSFLAVRLLELAPDQFFSFCPRQHKVPGLDAVISYSDVFTNPSQFILVSTFKKIDPNHSQKLHRLPKDTPPLPKKIKSIFSWLFYLSVINLIFLALFCNIKDSHTSVSTDSEIEKLGNM